MPSRVLLLFWLFLGSVAPAVDLKYILFKLDDVQAHWPYVVGMWTNVANTFVTNGLHASFGLIGDDTELYGETYPEFWNWFQHCQNNGIQFWNHTFHHTDLTALDRKAQWWQLARNQNLVRRKSGSNLGGYGAPMNLNNGDTLAVVRDMDVCDFHFFGPTNSAKTSLLRLGDMESPTLVPNFPYFTNNWARTLSNCSNANVDYLVLQGHPGSWDTNRFTNFLNVLRFLTDRGYAIVNPAEYIRIKTGDLAILDPAEEAVLTPGQAVTGSLTGSNVTWSAECWDGETSVNLGSGNGNAFAFTVPTSPNPTNRIRVRAMAGGFTRSRTWGIAPSGLDEATVGATPAAATARSGFEPGKVLDRALATGWSPSGALPQSLTVQLAADRSVGGVALAWKAGFHADVFTVQGSMDGATWFDLAGQDIGWGGLEHVPFAATNLRWLRVTVERSIRRDGQVELSELYVRPSGPVATPETDLVRTEADAMVHSSYPGSNFGGRMNLEVLSVNGRHGYMRFSLSNITRPVTRARLFLYPNQGYQIDALHTLKYVSNNQWDELGVTWSNRPALEEPLGLAAPYAYRSEFDVTTAVTRALAGEKRITFAICATNGTYMNYISREETNHGGSRAPTLELSHEPVPAPSLQVRWVGLLTNAGVPLFPARIDLSATCVSSQSVVTQVVFYADGIPVATDVDGADGWTGPWTVTNEGPHQLVVRAWGTGGLTAAHTNTVTVTNLAVSVVWTQPPAETTPGAFPCDLPIAAKAEPTNLVATRMDFFVDGIPLGADTDGSDGFGLVWSVRSNGIYGLRVVAQMSDGRAVTNTRTVTVHPPPICRIDPGTLVTNRVFTNRLTVTGGTGYWSTNGTAFHPFSAGSMALPILETTEVAFYACDSNGGTGPTNTARYTLSAGTLSLPKGEVDAVHRRIRFSFRVSGDGRGLPEPDLTVSFRPVGGSSWVPVFPSDLTGLGAIPWNGAVDGVWSPGSSIPHGIRFDLCVEGRAGGLSMAPLIVSNLDWSQVFRLQENLGSAVAVGSPFRGEGEGISFVNLAPETDLTLYTVSGQWVRRLRESGRSGVVLWNLLDHRGLRVDPGIYLCELRGGGETRLIRVMVVR